MSSSPESDGSLVADARAQIGVEIERAHGVVSATEFQRWALAVDDLNPLYFDADFARAHGFRDIVMPPLFVPYVITNPVRLADRRQDGIPLASGSGAVRLPSFPRRMAGGDELRFGETAHPGDALSVIRTVANIEPKAGRSGPFVLVTFASTYRRADGAMIAEGVRRVIARPLAGQQEGSLT